ncbi:hypothetical protein VCHA53O466_140040 [Vibrio chagasii]|nr:hypothetical protein VCHA53O466_140040 [Vibrio chagasii]
MTSSLSFVRNQCLSYILYNYKTWPNPNSGSHLGVCHYGYSWEKEDCSSIRSDTPWRLVHGDSGDVILMQDVNSHKSLVSGLVDGDMYDVQKSASSAVEQGKFVDGGFMFFGDQFKYQLSEVMVLPKQKDAVHDLGSLTGDALWRLAMEQSDVALTMHCDEENHSWSVEAGDVHCGGAIDCYLSHESFDRITVKTSYATLELHVSDMTVHVKG